MKKLSAMSKWIFMAVAVAALTGCALEPMQSENTEIRGAPDWVNKGSYSSNTKDGNMFYGVSSANPQGDLALQKSIADDRANAEVVRILVTFLDVVTNDFLQSTRYSDSGGREEATYRRIEETAARQVNDSFTTQIDDAIARQFKGGVSKQFKEDVTRKIKDAASRDLKEEISYQIDILRHIEEVISRQLKEAVSFQMKNTAQAHLVNARIIGNWRDPRTNTIWSISELDLKNVKKSMVGVSDLNVELKQFFDLNAENIFDRIIRERNNINPFSLR
jgi:hypothetical protein